MDRRLHGICGKRVATFRHKNCLNQTVLRFGLNSKYVTSDRLSFRTELKYGEQVGGDWYVNSKYRTRLFADDEFDLGENATTHTGQAGSARIGD